MPDLIFSPPPLQKIARAQFRNLLALAAILVSALIAVFGVSHPGQRSLVFMLYCVLGAWILMRALRRNGGATELSVPALIALAVAAVIGPVLLGIVLPADLPTPLGMNWAVLAALVVLGGLVAMALLLLCVLTQTLRPTTISMTNHLEIVSFNGAPSQISLHFARTLQELWVADVDSICYGRDRPRYVVGIAGNTTESERLGRYLAQFARGQGGHRFTHERTRCRAREPGRRHESRERRLEPSDESRWHDDRSVAGLHAAADRR